MNWLLHEYLNFLYEGKDGVPHIRSFKDGECEAYEPFPRTLGSSGCCETDGHYLCAECRNREIVEVKE